MAADITIVAAGIVAAAQPGLASEMLTPSYLPEPPAPIALEQAETPQIPVESLSLAKSQLELPPVALVTAPDFSVSDGFVESPSVESLAEVEALETELINEQLDRAPIALPVELPVAPPVVESAAPLSISPQTQSSFNAQRDSQGRARDRPQPQLTANQITNQAQQKLPQQPLATTPRPNSPTIAPTTEIAQHDLSPERLILAQVMMDSAEAQFLERSGLEIIEPSSASPSARGSGPIVSDGLGDDLGQVTSVSQLRDVQPTDWAYQATQSLVERYGCAAGYPDGSFRGNQSLSRYEFAAGLNACLDRVTELLPIAGAEGGLAAREDLAVAQQLAEQFEAELSQVRGRTESLEQRQASLEAQQFSTTTKLYGQSIFALRGSNNNNVDLFPVDGNPERSGAGGVTLGGSAELTLASSFRGNDLLLTTLQAGNIAASAPTQFTNMGRLAYEGDTDNQFVLSDLSYRFAATPNLGVIVGSHGVNPTNTFRGISPLEGSGDGALSRLGQRNPILELGGGRGGAGFDWQVSPSVSLQGIYSAAAPNQTGSNAGLFNGGYAAGGQVAAGLGRSADLGLHYLHSYSPDGSLGTGIGDAQVLSPFAPEGSSFRTHAVGATAAWRPTRHLTVGGWGGWTSSTPTDLSGRVQTTNWMGFAQVNDLFQRGNALGLLVGQPPKITSSNLPVGFNFPEFSDGGGRGGRRDTALHLEAFYRAQLNEQISVTPGIVVVRNPNHNAANDTLVVGAMRTTFRF